MSWSPPPSQRGTSPGWNLYGAPRPPGRRRRRVLVAVAVMAAIGVAVALLLVLLPRGSGGAEGPAPSSAAGRYLRLSDGTLLRCPLSDAGGFARCVATLDGGLAGIAFPASATQDITDMRTVLSLARLCVAQADEDTADRRNWPAACPQADAGPTDPATAASRDDAARHDFGSQLQTDDAKIRADLGLPPPPLPS